MAKRKLTFKDLFGEEIKYISYKLHGNTVTRRSSAPTKERINNDPAFHSQKMNNHEFEGAIALSSTIRNAKGLKILKEFSDFNIHGRLNGYCRKMIQLAPGELGKRDACLATHGKSLIGFAFNKQRPLNKSFKGIIELVTTPPRDAVTLYTQLSKNGIAGQPKQATHVQLTLAAVLVSKHIYNPNINKYQPLYPEENGVGQVANSEPIPITPNDIPIALQLQLPVQQPLKPTTALLVCYGITFGSITRQVFYPFKTGKAMNIINIL